MVTMTIKVGGMTCGGCAASVTRVLEAIEGVSGVDVSLERGEAVVQVAPEKADRARLIAAIEDAGFEAG